MSSFKLASTTFSTKADETLAALDAYAAKGSGVVNAIKDIRGALDYDALAGLKGGNLGEGLSFLSKTSIEGLKVDKEALTKGLLGSNSELIGSLRSLPNLVQSEILKVQGTISDITATVNGVQATIKNADLNTLQGVGDLINKISKTTLPYSFTDKSGLVTLGSNLIKEGNRLGLPDVYKTITSGISDKGIVLGITKLLLPNVISTSNINALLNIANSPVVKQITKISPSFVGDFVKNFTLQVGTLQSDHPAILKSIGESLTKLDARWKTTVQGNDDITDLSAVAACSPDMDKLFRTTGAENSLRIRSEDAAHLDTSALADPMLRDSLLKNLFNTSQITSGFSAPGSRPDAMSLLSESFPSII